MSVAAIWFAGLTHGVEFDGFDLTLVPTEALRREWERRQRSAGLRPLVARRVVEATPDGLLDPPALAYYLKCSEATLRSWRSGGTGPPWFTTGPKMIWYRLEHVLAWIDECERARTRERARVIAGI